MSISKKPSEEIQLNLEQKVQWVLHSTSLQCPENAETLQQWTQQLSVSDTQVNVATTQQRNRLTFSSQGDSVKVIEAHALYYQHTLGIRTENLQRLETLGKHWQPQQLGSWLEFNSLGANAGWYVPVHLSRDEVLATFDKESVNRRLFYRWTQYNQDFSCIQYGEDFSGMNLRQIVLSFAPQTPLLKQYHQALALADLYKAPTFPPALQEVLEHYDVSELAISLWLNPQGVVKFGLRIYQPSTELMIALAMLTGSTKTDEEALALVYSTFEQLAWVEIQHTSEGLTTEINFS